LFSNNISLLYNLHIGQGLFSERKKQNILKRNQFLSSIFLPLADSGTLLDRIYQGNTKKEEKKRFSVKLFDPVLAISSVLTSFLLTQKYF
jgi:hypothetical protein